MSLLRSARFPAIVLLVAAALGLIVANSPARAGRSTTSCTTYVGIPGVFELDDLALDPGRPARGLLLRRRRRAAVRAHRAASSTRRARRCSPRSPRPAACIVPIAVYLAFAAGSDAARGLAHPDGDRHRLRARGARGLRQGSARRPADLPARARDPRRHRRHRLHRGAVHHRRQLRAPRGRARRGRSLFGVLSRQLDTPGPRCRSRSSLVVLAIADVGARVRSPACTRRSPASRSGSRWRSSPRCARATRWSRGSTASSCRCSPSRRRSSRSPRSRSASCRRRSGACWSRSRRQDRRHRALRLARRCASASASAAAASRLRRPPRRRGARRHRLHGVAAAVGARLRRRSPSIRDQAILGVLAGLGDLAHLAGDPRLAARSAPSAPCRRREAAP